MAEKTEGRPAGAEEKLPATIAARDKKRGRLESELIRLERRRKLLSFWNFVCLLASIAMLAPLPILLLESRPDFWAIVLGTTFYVIGFLGLRRPVKPLDASIKEVEIELDLLEVDEVSEQRAEKLFKLHQVELKKYYDQTLRQSVSIFWAGIACIIIGFGIVAVGFTFVLNSDLGLQGKIVAAVLGAVSAILANYIAVIYIRMYSETIKSLTEFHNRLVTTHHLHFGNFLASKVDDPSLREETLSKMAIKLAD